MFEGKKPVKNKDLKIISYLNSYYATIDFEHLYQIDPIVVGLMKYIDGKRTYEEILEILAEKTGFGKEQLKPVLDQIFKELTDMKFIFWQ